MGSRNFFPEIWADDDQMAGLMSMIKSREVNPNDHDRKIKFWSEMIAKLCNHEKNAVFTVDELKRHFRRGDQLPGSLEVVIQHMLDTGEVVTLDVYNARNAGWLQRGYKTFFGSLWGASSFSSVQYVHLPTIKKQADSMLEFFHSEYAIDDDMLPEIVDSAEFFSECKNLIANKEAYNVALAELVNRGEVTRGSSKMGEEILKFRDNAALGPIKWTESDAGVHDMRRAMSKAEQDARFYVRKGDKNHAAHYLRLKKRALREIEAKDHQYQRLLDMMHQLGRTKQNKQILDAYRAGADAFRTTLQRQGISPEEVDETMDSIGDAMATAEEIQDAIAAGVQVPVSSDLDHDLEAELNAILAEGNGEIESKLKTLPNIPGDDAVPVSPVSNTHVNIDDSIASRLRKLREAA
ncbi:unnamed protein product [Thelazia callipaeda]|uniref:SNF7 family protein n=1 Tax=Thelazia callipaeda TaxID=103827 RepID=A0A0N5CJ57_THECL|nr:unnamed protein product [Thelazia callipaeda]